jgi:S1-C subfamily serine protease
MDVRRVRVSRETRLLLAIALISVAALWLLARIRYPERPATANPVPPVLAQIVPPSPFESIATSIRELEPRIVPALAVTPRASALAAQNGARPAGVRIALRFRENLAIALLEGELPEDEHSAVSASIAVRDAVSGLALVEVAGSPPAFLPRWSPSSLRPSARFLVAATALSDRIALTPFFVGALDSLATPIWPSDVWILPPASPLRIGTFVFTIDGAWAGIVAAVDETLVLVPPDAVMTVAEQLADRGPLMPVTLGVQVQAVSRGLGAALGTSAGVVVAWVDPTGPAAGKLAALDLIESFDGQPVRSRSQWDVRTARLAAGDPVHLQVRRNESLYEVDLTAAPPPLAAATVREHGPGLTLRTRPGAGAEVLRVEEHSAASRAGLKAGDVVTHIDAVERPSAASARRLLEMATPDRPLVMAVERDGTHHVVTLERTW